MKRLHVLPLAIAVLVFAQPAASQYAHEPSPPPEVTAWIQANAVPIDTVEAGNGFSDLTAIEPWIGNARVVAIGEATHGTREFFQFKHRMLEFLVERMGFTAFAIEAGFPEGRRVDRFVATGEGSAAEVTWGMGYWTWSTEEVAALVEWIRVYNADPTHTRKVRFYGIDMQITELACEQLLDYLAQVDPGTVPAAETALAHFHVPFSTLFDYWALPAAERDADVANLTELLGRFDSMRDAWIAATDEESWAMNRQSLVIVMQAQRFWALSETETDLRSATLLRDRAMAENALWALGREGAQGRMLLWAHNGHVYSRISGSFVPLGSHLRTALGKDLLVIGQEFDRGSFTALEFNPGKGFGDLQEFTVGGSRHGSLNEALDSAKMPRYMIDLRLAAADPFSGTWWRQFHAERSIGSVYSPAYDRYFYYYTLTLGYDLLFFQDVTTAARQLPY